MLTAFAFAAKETAARVAATTVGLTITAIVAEVGIPRVRTGLIVVLSSWHRCTIFALSRTAKERAVMLFNSRV